MSTGSNPISVYFVPILLPKDLFLTTFLNSGIHDHFMTGDWGATHKLKPRSFIKLYSTLISFLSTRVFSWDFSLIIKYYLFSKVVQYTVLEYNSIYNSTPLFSVILFLTNMNIMENYIKESTNVNTNNISPPWLPQSKSYLKILGIPYLTNNGTPIAHNQIEEIIKRIHLFNNVILVSSPPVIKTSPKSDIAVIWINIWDSQNGIKAKSLINRCFNIGKHIDTIHRTNINSGVPQCKNC